MSPERCSHSSRKEHSPLLVGRDELMHEWGNSVISLQGAPQNNGIHLFFRHRNAEESGKSANDETRSTTKVCWNDETLSVFVSQILNHEWIPRSDDCCAPSCEVGQERGDRVSGRYPPGPPLALHAVALSCRPQPPISFDPLASIDSSATLPNCVMVGSWRARS